MTDIPLLTSEIRDLNSNAEWWNEKALALALIAGVFAILATVFQVVAYKRAVKAGALAIKVGVLQEERDKARRDQLEDNLKDKEVKIAELESGTEMLRSENLRIQLAMRPREIVFGDRDGDKEVRQARLSVVAKFAGTKALIQSVSGSEPEELARVLAELLRRSKWSVVSLGPVIRPGRFASGVVLSTMEKSGFNPDGSLVDPTRYKFSEVSEAARALEAFLQLDLGPPFGPSFWGAHWEARQPNPATGKYDDEFEKDSILISVGDLPLRYSLSDAPPKNRKSK